MPSTTHSFVYIPLLTIHTIHIVKMTLRGLVAWTMRWTSRYSYFTIFLSLSATSCSV
ncbi:hypothetical protein P692DRAFT_20480831 [Suillus brevipes Sb2]|nr:hypothetical protein P692DRAFT_20480831 [Suillus brevipes Sb2]